MARTNKELKALKQKMLKEDPAAFRSISKKNVPKQKIVRNQDYETNRKKVIKWNFKVNQLVKVKTNYSSVHSNEEYGLIVADVTFHGTQLSKNWYYVLVGTVCKQLNGSSISMIDV